MGGTIRGRRAGAERQWEITVLREARTALPSCLHRRRRDILALRRSTCSARRASGNVVNHNHNEPYLPAYLGIYSIMLGDALFRRQKFCSLKHVRLLVIQLILAFDSM